MGRLPYYIPILQWYSNLPRVDPSRSLMEFRLPRYDMKEDFSFDLVAGLAVAAMLVPQVGSILCIHTLTLPAVTCVRYSRRFAPNNWSLHGVGTALAHVASGVLIVID